MEPEVNILPENFADGGVLPPGDYEMTLDGLRSSILVAGPSDRSNCQHWDEEWRLELVSRLELLCKQLWSVGIDEIYIDGSFVEDKEHPNDIDGYFVCGLTELASGRLQEDLNLLDEDKVWTWDPDMRRPYLGYPKAQLPMWHKHRVELYPHVGQLSGIQDEFGNDQEFPAAFRKTRGGGMPKGIIRISRGVCDD